MSKICDKFSCVYAMSDGCSIKGYVDESELNGEKVYCRYAGLTCVSAKCSRCMYEGEVYCLDLMLGEATLESEAK